MKHQEFDGIVFYQTEDGDYFRHSVKGTTILMHRYVWEYYNCKIPKGYHVHHIDGDKGNNDISNLRLMKGAEHFSLHGKLLTEEEREWRRQNLITNAVPKAIEWHKSPEGREWHRQHAQHLQGTTLNADVERVCLNCGNTFLGKKFAKFCCNACKSQYVRRTNKNKEERVCVICGAPFLTDKYKKGQACSRECRAILGHRKGN